MVRTIGVVLLTNFTEELRDFPFVFGTTFHERVNLLNFCIGKQSGSGTLYGTIVVFKVHTVINVVQNKLFHSIVELYDSRYFDLKFRINFA